MCSGAWLRILILLSVTVSMDTGTTVFPIPETFTVKVSGPVSARVGSSVSLPCELSPAFDANSLDVRWYRPENFSKPVLLSQNGRIQEAFSDPRYPGRVSLVGGLERGNVSLGLENVTVADEGEYVCHVTSDQWYDKASLSLSVNVEEDSSPSPNTSLQSVLVNSTNHVLVYSLVTVLVSLVIIGVIGLVLWKHKGRVGIGGKEQTPDQAELEEKAQESTNLLENWSYVRTFKVDISLDPDTAGPNLKISQDRKKVQYESPNDEKKPQSVKHPHVQCKERLRSGEHYWEVMVWDRKVSEGQKVSWYVGVCRDTAERMAEVRLTPQTGFWILSYDKADGFQVNTDPPTKVTMSTTSQKVGVYLNWDRQTLSFYDVYKKTLIYTFDVVVATNGFIPLVCPGQKDSYPMRID